MQENKTLDSKLGNEFIEKPKSIYQRATNYVRDTISSKAYWVDTLTGTSFFQPLYSAVELLTGNPSTEEFIARRLTGFGMALCTTRPLAKARDCWRYNFWKADKKKRTWKDNAADATFALGVVPTMYGITIGIGSLAGEQSPTELLETTWKGAATALGALTVFVPYLDKSRKIFGTSPLDEELKKLEKEKHLEK